MDFDKILNLERRTGIKNSEIDDFTRKAAEVQAAIEGMMNGTLKPEDVKIDGIESEEEQKRKKAEREKRLEEQKRRAIELQIQRKSQERERWWSGADIFAANRSKEEVHVCENDELIDKKSQELKKYTADYSRWEQWTPQDPATLEEEAQKQAESERIKNQEFEKSNPDFCKQFMDDMKIRNETAKKKQDSADVARLKGNRFFKRKEYDQALEHYFDALKNMPYEPKTLTNIAQVYIKTKAFDDALEFLSRTLYLDPFHIKALSRKAFVLAETGQPREALEIIETAVKLEPDNADLVLQQKDLKVIVQEFDDERVVEALTGESENRTWTTAKAASAEVTVEGAAVVAAGVATEAVAAGEERETASSLAASASIAMPAVTAAPSNVTSADAAFAPSSSSATLKTSGSVLDDVQKQTILAGSELIDWLLDAVTEDLPERVDSSRSSDEVDQKYHKCMELLRKEKNFRVYLRTSGKLATLVDNLKAAIGSVATGIEALCSRNRGKVLHRWLCFLATAIAGERSSKLLVVTSGLAASAKALLQSEDVISEMDLLEGLTSLLRVCVVDNTCPQAAQLVLKDKGTLLRLGSILGELSFKASIHSNSTVTDGKLAVASASINYQTSPEFAVTKHCLQIVREYAFAEATKTACTVDMGSLVCASAAALHVQASRVEAEQAARAKKTKVTKASKAAMAAFKESSEFALETLLGLSQLELMRPFFAVAVPLASQVTTESQAKTIDVSAVSSIMKLMKCWEEQKSNCMAVLMNSSLEPRGDVRAEVYRAGGLDLALGALRASSEWRSSKKGEEAPEAAEIARSVGLLSRLVAVEEAQTLLSDPSVYGLLCVELKDCCAVASQQAKVTPTQDDTCKTAAALSTVDVKWKLETRTHLVRTLATMTKPDVACKAVALSHDIIGSLLSVFPMPRVELNEITPQSVILMPNDPAPPLLLGNTARCLMPYADDAVGAEILFGGSQSQKGKYLFGIEKLICAMATCTDIRVRKNIAILLAKGCRCQEARQKVQHLRGMQMMIELQDKF